VYAVVISVDFVFNYDLCRDLIDSTEGCPSSGPALSLVGQQKHDIIFEKNRFVFPLPPVFLLITDFLAPISLELLVLIASWSAATVDLIVGKPSPCIKEELTVDVYRLNY
jgi:hypothetical protein